MSNNAQIMNIGAIHVADGTTVDFVPEVDVPAGSIVVVGKLVGIAKFGIGAGSRGSITVRGVFRRRKGPNHQYSRWDDPLLVADQLACGQERLRPFDDWQSHRGRAARHTHSPFTFESIDDGINCKSNNRSSSRNAVLADDQWSSQPMALGGRVPKLLLRGKPVSSIGMDHRRSFTQRR